MKRVALISNPVAARANRKGLESITTVLEAEGYEVAVYPTEGHGHAAKLAAAAVKEGVDIVATYGGDGTAMQAAEGLHGSSVPLGLVPGGTANLLAANLRIPRNPVKAAKIIATGARRTIDLGRLETAEGTRYFAVGCGAGYDADLVTRPTHESKRRWGVGAYIGYVARTAHKIKPLPFTIDVDGKSREIRCCFRDRGQLPRSASAGAEPGAGGHDRRRRAGRGRAQGRRFLWGGARRVAAHSRPRHESRATYPRRRGSRRERRRAGRAGRRRRLRNHAVHSFDRPGCARGDG